MGSYPVAIDPSLELLPTGGLDCGRRQTVSTALVNPGTSEAPRADVTLGDLPRWLELVRGEKTQEVSGGTLDAGATSKRHSWTVRQPSFSKGDATVSVVGKLRQGGETLRFPISITIASCKDGDLPTALSGELKSKGDHLIASGTVTAAEGTPRGDVRIKLRRPGANRAFIADLDRSGSFKMRIRACEPGSYEAFARFQGSGGFEPSSRTSLGVVRRRGC